MKQILLFIFISMAATIDTQSAILYKPQARKIVLKATSVNPRPKSTVNRLPVEAYLHDDGLELSFTGNMGSINVTIAGNGASVYQKSINAAAGNSVYIDMLNWDSGSYTLIITDAAGNVYYGEFALQ